MNIQEIKNAVDNGLTVHADTEYYTVVKGKSDYLIKGLNGHYIGLTWADGVTPNFKKCWIKD